MRPLLVAGLLVAAFLLAGVLGLAGIGAAEIATGIRAPQGWDQLSDAFSVVNGIFSAFALIVVLATLWVQFNELRMQRSELRMQREAAEQSKHELFRSSEAVFRELHMHLLEMAINDEDLAGVWPEFGPGVSAVRRKQFLYANLILSHLNLSYRLAERDEQFWRETIADVFLSSIVQEFWEAVRDYRLRVRAGSAIGADFDRLCEEGFQRAREPV
ncbi:DUF6082 family protein [Dactylosporangium sp. NPDC051541]|uniref:DUF6082 family protein n=1 Tax=Dactylosporangium sp. NPDC051541 TaxID=3363977 RepID=UPI003789F8A0